MADDTPEISTPNYSIGYEDLAKVYIRRSAEKEEVYLLSNLRPGMRALDIGWSGCRCRPRRVSGHRYGAITD